MVTPSGLGADAVRRATRHGANFAVLAGLAETTIPGDPLSKEKTSESGEILKLVNNGGTARGHLAGGFATGVSAALPHSDQLL
jgi:hypothetical protein